MERGFKELRSFVFGGIVDVAEAIARLLVESQMGAVLHLFQQQLSRIAAVHVGRVVNWASQRVSIADGMRRLVEGHAVHDDVLAHRGRAVFLRIFPGLARAAVLQRFLTGCQQEYSHHAPYYLLHNRSQLIIQKRAMIALFPGALRRVRDSNPRYPKGVYRISSPARSITLPTLLFRFADAKVVIISETAKYFRFFFCFSDAGCLRSASKFYIRSSALT